MIFSELYSAYYNAVARILKEACARPLSGKELREIAGREAFGESLPAIEQAFRDGRWQLLHGDGTTPLRHVPSMPLTLLQRRWLKAVAEDPRMQLFPGTVYEDPETEPLFRQEDLEIFDRCADGDPYNDEGYIQRFRMILEAVKNHRPLVIEAAGPEGGVNRWTVMPEHLEYSEKDDKFRLAGYGFSRVFINLARIIRCEWYAGTVPPPKEAGEPEKKTVELELTDERNALERVLMHFAHFEKQAERTEGQRYRIRIVYSAEDETELLIRILSFGPVIRVCSPEDFVNLVRERLRRQLRFRDSMFTHPEP